MPTERPADIATWRKGERRRLRLERAALSKAEDARKSCDIVNRLSKHLGPLGNRIISAYWPMGGEPDLRPWMGAVADQGGHCALPVVMHRAAPMTFRLWHRETPMVPGIWDIPIPASGEEIIPDVVIAPLLGFDRSGFRLGHGGGYYDRTLAVLSPRPQIVGIGYAHAELETIHPLPHDIAMDVIVTGRECILPSCSA